MAKADVVVLGELLSLPGLVYWMNKRSLGELKMWGGTGTNHPNTPFL